MLVPRPAINTVPTESNETIETGPIKGILWVNPNIALPTEPVKQVEQLIRTLTTNLLGMQSSGKTKEAVIHEVITGIMGRMSLSALQLLPLHLGKHLSQEITSTLLREGSEMKYSAK